MEIMKPFRERIDALDDRIIDLLIERTGIIREVGRFKFENDIPAVLPDRVIEVRERAAERAASKGLDRELVRTLYQTIIDYSCSLEEEIKADLAQDKTTKVAGG
ncbi:MAG: chorismate mutase [Rhodospirillales bacterium]|nr:chorismate mutase [Rhodospirillales bacterium]MCB9996269.1 chorismate mutase [Rhodospirillales bacterium]